MKYKRVEHSGLAGFLMVSHDALHEVLRNLKTQGRTITNREGQTMNTPQDETCSICGRVKFGQCAKLYGVRWRHGSCEIGSESWLEYYQALSPSDQLPLRQFFELTYPQPGAMQQREGADNETT